MISLGFYKSNVFVTNNNNSLTCEKDVLIGILFLLQILTYNNIYLWKKMYSMLPKYIHSSII